MITNRWGGITLHWVEMPAVDRPPELDLHISTDFEGSAHCCIKNDVEGVSLHSIESYFERNRNSFLACVQLVNLAGMIEGKSWARVTISLKYHHVAGVMHVKSVEAHRFPLLTLAWRESDEKRMPVLITTSSFDHSYEARNQLLLY
ncbi:hypothetical protein TNCV_2919491 [Trichonephila clavipes]|nr:hypothetical protein TNCV_2919491 [Trichonephila clavipes]